MSDKTTFAALMTAAQSAALAPTPKERQAHESNARALARQLLATYPPDVLVVTAASAALGLLARQLQQLGADPSEFVILAEMEVDLNDDQ